MTRRRRWLLPGSLATLLTAALFGGAPVQALAQLLPALVSSVEAQARLSADDLGPFVTTSYHQTIPGFVSLPIGTTFAVESMLQTTAGDSLDSIREEASSDFLNSGSFVLSTSTPGVSIVQVPEPATGMLARSIVIPSFFFSALALFQVTRKGDLFPGSTFYNLFDLGGRTGAGSGFDDLDQIGCRFIVAACREGIAIWTVPGPDSVMQFVLGVVFCCPDDNGETCNLCN